MERFFKEFRPKIKVPYLLITSKTDYISPMAAYNHSLDDDPLLMAWYGTNGKYKVGAGHKKFTMMPLGLQGTGNGQQGDFSLLNEARNYANPFGGDKSKWIQSKALANATDTTEILFVKFGVNGKSMHRQIFFDIACSTRTQPPLDDISCNQTKKANHRETYAAASKYLFGLSPRGNGDDCYRTYELLLSGLIPIVNKHPEYDELFQDLPVLQVDDWHKIKSQEDLLKLMREYVASPAFQNNTFDKGWERLFLKYWRNKVLEDSGRKQHIVKDEAGNQYYKAWQYTIHKKPHMFPFVQ